MSLLGRWRWSQLSGSEVVGPLPGATLPVIEAPLLAIDLEMTGLDPQHDEIISIGWVPVECGAVMLRDAVELHLRAAPPDAGLPGRSVGQSATVHGIRDCDRDTGIDLDQALAMLIRALSGRIAVFHHAPLDTAFLDRALRAAGQTGWQQPTIDTLAWFRQRQRRRGEEAAEGASTLDAARWHYGLPERSAHNALDDALSCAELALVMAARSRARLIDVCALPGGRS